MLLLSLEVIALIIRASSVKPSSTTSEHGILTLPGRHSKRGVSLIDPAAVCAPNALTRLQLLLLLVHATLLLDELLMSRIALLETLRVPQRVQRMIRAGAAWADAGKHDDLDFVAREEGISQHHRQLALSEWHVLPLRGLTFLCIDGADALFQAEERLVDLCTLGLTVLRVINAVRGPLRASQVDQEELAALFNALFLDFDLTYGVRATGCIV